MKTVIQQLNLKFLLMWSIFLCLGLGATITTEAQNKEYANSQENSVNNGSFASVEDPDNAVDGDLSTYAELESKLVSILGIQYSGEANLTMKFQNIVSAKKTSYVKIDNITSSGLNIDVLDVVGGLVGLLDSDLLNIDVYDGNTVLNTSDVETSIVEDKDGVPYIAVTPHTDYTSIKVQLKYVGNLLGVSLGGGIQLKIYDAFYYTDGEDCGRPLYTGVDESGISLSVLELDDQHLNRAIDDDEDSYATLDNSSLLGLSVASTLSQYFYFPTESDETTTVNIKIGMNASGLLDLDLLGATEVVLYNAEDEVVYERSLKSSLLHNTNALGLLDDGDPVTLTFAPGRSFDRMELRMNSPVNLSLIDAAFRIYDVQRYNDAAGCQNPEIDPVASATDDPFDEASCATDLLDFDNVDFAQRAVDGNNESYATLYADAGDLLVGDPAAGFIEMDLGQVSANQTTYVRIGYDEDVLDALLGGSLGELVGDLLNDLALGNQYIQVEAKDGNTTVLDENSSNAFEGTADGVVTLVEDNIGRYYLAITPDAAYDRIRITNHVEALLSTGKQAALDVYNACFETGDDSCFPANFTSYKGGGANLSLGDLSEAGVKDPYKAISENSSEYSEVNLGVLGLLSDVYQTIYFNQPSQTDDHVQIRLMVEPSSALSLDALGAYKIKFFNGKDQVGPDYDLQDGLVNNIDLLALFSSGGVVELDFEPDGTFDRVDIGAESVVELNVDAEPLRIYNVERYGEDCPLSTTEHPYEDPTCISQLIDSDNADNVQNLFDEDFDSYATLKSGAGSLLGLNDYQGYVEMGYDQTMEAETTSYIRIDFDDGILDALVSGSLGDFAGDLLDNVVLGDHYFEVEVKQDGDVVLEGSSKEANAGGNERIRVVQDAQGRYYIAVTPEDDYNAVRITDHTNSALGLLSEPNTMNVYGMCTEMEEDACQAAFATSYEYSGLNLGVDAVGSAGVTNPEYVLDDNTQHYSEISNGTLGAGASTKQWIFFNTVSDADDVVMVSFETEQGGADLDLLGGLQVIAYKGEEPVDTLDWQNGIVNGVNVLDQIDNNQLVEVPYQPGEKFDRISVGIKTLVQASVFPPIHLYKVERCYDLEEPEFSAWKSYEIDGDATLAEVQGGEEIEYTLHIENTGEQDLKDYIVEDEIPQHTTYVDNSGGDYDANENTVRFENIDVAVGYTETLTFKVEVDENLTDVDEIHNLALVKKDENDEGKETYPPLDNENPDEPDDSGDTGTDIPVDKVYEIESWKAYEVEGDASKTAVSGGETVTYKIYVRNTGNQDLTDIAISDELPDGVSYVSGGTLNGNEVEFTIPSLGYDETSSALTFTVEVDEDLSGIEELKNIAVSTSSDLDDTESYPPVDNENPEDPDDTGDPGTIIDVEPEHRVEFSKSGVSNNSSNDGQAAANDVITYTLTVKNTGNKKLENLSVSDLIPGNTTVEDAGDFTENSGTMEATINSLEVDEDIQLSFEVRVDNNIDVNAIAEIENTAEVIYPNEDNSGDYTETADFDMPTDCNPLDAGDIDLTLVESDICVDQEFTLQASSTQSGLSNVVYKWYKTADLSDTPVEGDEITTSVDETTTFYVTIEADGYCFTTPPAEIEVEVEDLPAVPSITTNDDLEVCEGDQVTLEADGNADSYIWFYEGQEIQGETSSTLEASDDGDYIVIAVNSAGCESEESAAITVTVNDLPDKPTIDPQGDLEICEGETIELEASDADDYRWYKDGDLMEDENGAPLNVQTIAVDSTGNYTVKVKDNGTECISESSEEINVTVNPAPEISIDGNQFITVAVDATVPWPTVTSSDGNIIWLDEEGDQINENNLPTSFNAVGTHTYTVVVDNGTCENSRTITVNVFDEESCPQPMERVYASESSWGSIITGGVSNQDNAVDGDVKTYSTITTGVGLAGVGTTWQTLKFDETVDAGTPVTIKLGKEYSGLMLAGGLSVVGVKKNSLGDYIDIGVIQPVDGGLLDLLVADNVVEYTFVPSTIAGAQDYDGIRISQGALVSAAQNAKVYGAYYEKPGQPNCDPIDVNTNPDVQDVLHGVKDLGLGAASATASVVDPWDAVDNDENSSAKIVRGVSALNAAFLTVIFKEQVMPTDSIQLIMKDPTNNGLTLDLLTGYQFQRYLGDTPVGDPIQGGNVLDLKLLTFTSDKVKLLVGSYDEPYDRIQIAYGSIVEAQLGDQVEIFDVSIKPTVEDESNNQEFVVCQGDTLHLKEQDECTVYEVYDEENNLLETDNNLDFEIPEDAEPGAQTYTVQTIRQGCEVGTEVEIEMQINATPELNGFEVSKNGESATTYQPGNPTIEVDPNDEVNIHADADLNVSNVEMIIWEMQDPDDPDNWIEIPFGEVDPSTYDLSLAIPPYGVIEVEGTEIDIRQTNVKVRAIMLSKSTCSTTEELTLQVSGKSYMISNPHIISKFKN